MLVGHVERFNEAVHFAGLRPDAGRVRTRRRDCGDTEETDYAWKAEGTRAGRMILTARNGQIARLVVTFE